MPTFSAVRGKLLLLGGAVRRRRIFSLVLLAANLALAQAPDLTYKQRGPYKEGIRTRPSTFSRVDLLAACIDYVEPAATNPGVYHALFYMPEHLNDLHLVIREAEDLRYFYWLDGPQDPGWQEKGVNRFDWPTTVIRYLNYTDKHQLVLDDLGALVRVGEIPQQSERVLPVVLYSGQPPQQVDSYSFAFRPDGPARLTFEVFPENSRTAVTPRQTFDHAVADKTQWVRWSVTNWKDGWYLVKIGGYALAGDGAEITQEVHFYHSSKLVK
jgi:hypothetical protein